MFDTNWRKGGRPGHTRAPEPRAMTAEEEKLRRILVPDQQKAPVRKGDPLGGQVEYGQRLSQEQMQKETDAKNIKSILPDVETAEQLLVSTILSPKDLITVNLIYRNDSSLLGDTTAALTRITEAYLDSNYKIKRKLPEMLRKILFDQGSYPVAILPKTRIDAIINGKGRVSNEDYREFGRSSNFKHIGVLGSAIREVGEKAYGRVTLETYQAMARNINGVVVDPSFGLTINDNHDALKVRELVSKRQEDDVRGLYRMYGNIGNEGRQLQVEDTKKKPEDDRSLYKPRFYDRNSVLDIGRSDAGDIVDADDIPLVIPYPASSVIPVHTPSDPTDHLGYFIVTDQFGSPVSRIADDTVQSTLGMRNSQMNGTTNMLERMKNSLMDFGYRGGSDKNLMLQMFSGLVEEELNTRLKNGIYGEGVAVSRSDEIYKIMFSRACSQMQTQLIYIPKFYLTYFAFRYNDYGVGESLLEATKMLSALRAILLMGNMFASIKNSINHRKVNLTLSPKDPDPDGTVETTLNELARATQVNMPIMEPNPVSIVGYFQNAGTQVNIKGHPRYPETEIDVENFSANHVKVDTELEEKMQERHMMGLGVPPEAVNTSMDVNYATSLVQSNLLFTKNAMIYQEEFSPQLTDHIRKYILANGELLDQLLQVVRADRAKLTAIGVKDSNTDMDIVVHFVNNLVLELPSPDMTQLSTQLEEFNKYSESLDVYLDTMLGDQIFGSSVVSQLGQLGTSIAEWKAITKAQLQRQFLIDNGIMPELFDLVAKTIDDKPLSAVAEQHNVHCEALISTLLPVTIARMRRNQEIDELLQKVGEDNVSDGGGDGGSGGDTEGGDDEGADGGGDGGGDPDGGGEDDDPFALPAEAGGEDDGDSGDDAPAGEDAADDTAEEPEPEPDEGGDDK